MGETFADLARTGPLLLAIGDGRARRAGQLPVAVRAAAGARLSVLRDRSGRRRPRPVGGRRPGPPAAASPWRSSPGRGSLGRVLAGTLLFVAGFAVVFTAMAILFASIGRALFDHQRTLEIVVGVLIIVLGLAFLGLDAGAAARGAHPAPAGGRACSARRSSARSSRCPGCRAPGRRWARCSGSPRRRRPDRPGRGARAGVLPRARHPVRRLRAGLRAAPRPVQGRPAQQPLGHPRSAACCSSLVGLALVTGGWNQLPDLAADLGRRRRGGHLMSTVDERTTAPAPPPAPAPARAVLAGRAAAQRAGGSSPACVPRWCCCSCSPSPRSPARCCRSATSNIENVQGYFRRAPGPGARAGPARRLRRVRLALVRRDLPAAVHLAGRLPRAAAARPRARAAQPCRRPCRRGWSGCRSTPRSDGRRRRRRRSRRRCASGGGGWRSAATRCPRRRATSRRPATCSSTSRCWRCWSASALGSWYGWHGNRLLVAGPDHGFCNTLQQYDEYVARPAGRPGDLPEFCLTLDEFQRGLPRHRAAGERSRATATVERRRADPDDRVHGQRAAAARRRQRLPARPRLRADAALHRPVRRVADRRPRRSCRSTAT